MGFIECDGNGWRVQVVFWVVGLTKSFATSSTNAGRTLACSIPTVMFLFSRCKNTKFIREMGGLPLGLQKSRCKICVTKFAMGLPPTSFAIHIFVHLSYILGST